MEGQTELSQDGMSTSEPAWELKSQPREEAPISDRDGKAYIPSQIEQRIPLKEGVLLQQWRENPQEFKTETLGLKKKKKALFFFFVINSKNTLQTPPHEFSRSVKTSPTCYNQGEADFCPWVGPFFAWEGGPLSSWNSWRKLQEDILPPDFGGKNNNIKKPRQLISSN